MIIKKKLFIKLLINFLLTFSIFISPMDSVIVDFSTQNSINITNSQNQELLNATIAINKNHQYYIQPIINNNSSNDNQPVSHSTSTTKINNEIVEQLHINYNGNSFALYLDKNGNVIVNELNFYSYKLQIIALTRDIFLYNNLLAKMGLILEGNSVFNYSNLKIYRDLFIKTSPNGGKFINNQNIYVYTGNLKVDIYNAFINNGTIFCNENFSLNQNNKASYVKLGRLEVFGESNFENTHLNSIFQIDHNSCKLGKKTTGLPNGITVKTPAPKLKHTKIHYHKGNSPENYNGHEYQFNDPNYLPAFLQINTNEKPVITADGSLVMGNFSNDLPMPNVTSPIFADKKAKLQNIVYTGGGIEATGVEEQITKTGLYSSVISQDKLSIQDTGKTSSLLKNGSSLGATSGSTDIGLKNKHFAIVTDKTVQFPKHDPTQLIHLKPGVETPRYSFLQTENDQNYMYKHPFENMILDQTSFGFLDKFQSCDTSKNLNDNLKFYTSPEIYKELITLNSFKYMGKPFIGEYTNSNQQLEELIQTGNIYACMHGKSTELQSNKNNPIVDQKLTPELRQLLIQLIKKFGSSITADELFKRINQKISGTHAFVLTNAQISKSPFSFIIAYVAKEKNETAISLGLHLAEKPLNGATIFGHDINVKAKILTGNKANFNAKNNINLTGENRVLFYDSNFDAGNILKFESNGKVNLYAPNIKAKSLVLYGKLGNNIFPLHFNIETKHKKDAWSFLGFHSETTTIKQKLAQVAKLAINNLIMKTDKDNNLSGIDLKKPLDLLVLDAGGNNSISCAQEQLKIQQETFSAGFDFCGISLLIDGEFKKCLFELATSDPLVRETLKFKDVNSLADAFAQAIYAGIETFKALVQISRSNKDLKFLLSRFGILDASGKFSPKITIGLCSGTSNYEKTTYKTSTISAKNAFVNGKNLDVETNFNAENFINNSEKTNFKGNKETEKSSSSRTGVNVSTTPTGDVTGNINHSQSSETSIKNKSNTNNITNATMNGEEVNFEGTKNNIDNLSGNVDKMSIKSAQDTSSKNSSFFSVSGGASSGSVAYADSSSKSKVVNEQTELNVKNSNNLHLKVLAVIGALLNSSQATNLNAQTVQYKNIIDTMQRTDRSFSVTASPYDVVPVLADIGYSHSSETSINRATVSNNIQILTKSEISGLNRDIAKCRETLSKESIDLRAVIPIPNTNIVNEGIKDINELFSGKREINTENVGKIIEQFEQAQKEAEAIAVVNKLQVQPTAESNQSSTEQQSQTQPVQEVPGIIKTEEIITDNNEFIEVKTIENPNNLFSGQSALLKESDFKFKDYVIDPQTGLLKMTFYNDYKIKQVVTQQGVFDDAIKRINPQILDYCYKEELSRLKTNQQNNAQDYNTNKYIYALKLVGSIAADISPLGPLKAAIQVYTNKDLFTGDQFDTLGKGLNLFSLFFPCIKHINKVKVLANEGKLFFTKLANRFAPKAVIAGTDIAVHATEKGIEQAGKTGTKLATSIENNAAKVAGSGAKANNAAKAADKAEHLFEKGLTYKPSPLHTKTGNAIKSKAPINGQAALDKSVKIITKNNISKARIAIQEGEIVVFKSSGSGVNEGVYHGYVCAFDKLDPEAVTTLYKLGWATLKGKILVK